MATKAKQLETLKKQLWFHEQMENTSMINILKARIEKLNKN